MAGSYSLSESDSLKQERKTDKLANSKNLLNFIYYKYTTTSWEHYCWNPEQNRFN